MKSEIALPKPYPFVRRGSRCGLDGPERKRLPENVFADVARNEERNRASETVSFREKVVQHEYHHSADEELENDQSCVTNTEFRNWAVHAKESVKTNLTKRNNEANHLFSGLE